MIYPVLTDIEFDELPLHGEGARVTNIKLDFEISDLAGPEYSVTGIKFGVWAGGWEFHPLPTESLAHAAIMAAATKNKLAIELIREKIIDALSDDDRAALAEEICEPDHVQHALSASQLGVKVAGHRF